MNQNDSIPYDAILLVSFGGPESREDVIPFLQNVLRGRNVPHERMLEVAEHYYHFDGVSPINEQNRELIKALRAKLPQMGVSLPIYWGNRNWQPFLLDAISEMKQAGVKRALAFVTSTFSCYSGCRQYRENILQACEMVGGDSPRIDKLRVFYNHPLWIDTMTDRVNEALVQIPSALSAQTPILFTAHSIPMGMAANSNYMQQLNESCRLVAERIANKDWQLVFQSRSGPPSQPWLEPDVNDAIRSVAKTNDSKYVIVVPIGFISDHMEVLFDLDYEASATCEELGMKLIRAGTAGTHPKFVELIGQLVLERMGACPKSAIGNFPPNHDVCPVDCCLPGRPATPATTSA
jgi:protoporphyrin/coproporphyrin ferrochelatase